MSREHDTTSNLLLCYQVLEEHYSVFQTHSHQKHYRALLVVPLLFSRSVLVVFCEEALYSQYRCTESNNSLDERALALVFIDRFVIIELRFFY